MEFIIHFFFRILSFKESCNLIMWQHFRSYLETFLRIGSDVSITILLFKLFQKTSNHKNFQKQNENIFGCHFSSFCPNFGKSEFSWKRWLCQFLNITIIYHRVRIRKNYSAIPENNIKLEDRKYWQTDSSDFKGLSVGRCFNY